MTTELNLSASQFIILAIVLSLAVTVLWLKKSYFQLDIEPVTDNTTRNVGTRYGLIFNHKASITTRKRNIMTEKFNLPAERAKSFGLELEEAYNTMVAFSLENKFDCYPPQDRKKLESVFEFLMNATDMWMNGQIMVSSQERGVNEKK